MNFKINIASLSALYCGLAYIIGIIFFSTTNYLSAENIIDKIEIIHNYQIGMYIINNIIYILFGFVLSALVFKIYRTLKPSFYNQLGLIFGLFWCFALIFAGLIFNTGMQTILDIYTSNPDLAITVWTTIETIFNAIGGSTEILGGIWILTISILAQKESMISVYVNSLGIIIGISGLLSHVPGLENFQMVFGLLQITWFFALIHPLHKANLKFL